MFLDYLALFFLIFASLAIFYGIIAIHDIPYEIAKKGQLIHIEVKGLPLPVSADSYRVEWTETTRSHAGVELDKHVYEATVTVQVNPPTSDAVIVKNPGGVYITSLSVGKLLGSAPAVPQGMAPSSNRTQE